MLYNFIICEDNEIFRDKYIKIINKLKKNLNILVNIYCFENYCDELKKIIYSDLENKIYILDLFLYDKKGNEIAQIIRKTDLLSLIIFITSHYNDFSFDITNGEYIYLKFIDKFNDYENELYNTLNSTIEKLQEYGLVDDEKFAKNYFDSLSTSKGKRAIANKLREKGISSEIIDELLENVEEDDELEKAIVLANKFVKNRQNDTKCVQKCLAHLIYKGYDYNVAQQATKIALKNREVLEDDWT